MRRFPSLPVEEEGRLADARIREDFIARVFAYARLKGRTARSPSSACGPSDDDRPRPERGQFRSVPVTVVGRPDRSTAGTTHDLAAVEEPLEVRLHGKPFAVIMRTPGEDRALAAGFLLSEGVVRSADDIGAVEHCRHPERPDGHNVVDVYLFGEARALARHDAGRSAQGVDQLVVRPVRPTHDRLAQDARVGAAGDVDHDDERGGRTARPSARTPARVRRTGGLHAAGLFTPDGVCEASAEDVGRHNAVDKVIGSMLLEDRLPIAAHALAVSGRTSFEIVQKAWLAGIGLVCAVSAPSNLAIELAVEAGITLLGFARDGGFNVYSHPTRLPEVWTHVTHSGSISASNSASCSGWHLRCCKRSLDAECDNDCSSAP